jgi:restriction system protein
LSGPVEAAIIDDVPVTIPTHVQLLWPTLQAIREMGSSATIEEITEKVTEREGFTEEQQSVLHKEGPRTEIEYRLAWARSYLKGMGALENSRRGVWSVSDAGRALSEEDVQRLHAQYRAERQAATRERRRSEREGGADVGDADEDETRGWREKLLAVLLDLPPDRFEHLARRLLREAGFVTARVTGRTGDGGIDGIGVFRLSLVSFQVFFQCKRYRGSVRAGAVRDFRGAMAGRGDRGLLITTGSFTAEAKQEATRDGAPPIDLIDGDRLCDLLKEHRLGVRTEVREIEDVIVEGEFFAEI